MSADIVWGTLLGAIWVAAASFTAAAGYLALCVGLGDLPPRRGSLWWLWCVIGIVQIIFALWLAVLAILHIAALAARFAGVAP